VEVIVAFAIAFAIAFATVPIVARIAERCRLVDHPGPLKIQQQPVPYGGGIAVLVAIVIPVARDRATLLIPLVLACLLGLADDTRDLPVTIRLASEVVIGVVTAWVAAPHAVGYLAGGVILEVVLLNAANLLDGLDGLLASVAAVSAFGFGVVLAGAPATLAIAVAGALLGFGFWNRPPARIFLGDAGSYLVGTALAIMSLAAIDSGASTACAAALLVGVPVGDTVVAIVRRIRAGKPLLQGDRGHVYDQLVDRGWHVPLVLVACASAQLILMAVAIGVSAVDPALAVGITVVTVVLVGAVALARFTAPRTWVRDG
jgi:UDP-GlcNAc:undecaprenyl-phosphate GlcNAc-1-phosphate transferase